MEVSDFKCPLNYNTPKEQQIEFVWPVSSYLKPPAKKKKKSPGCYSTYRPIPSTQQLSHMTSRPMNVSKGWERVLTSCVCGVSGLWPLGFQQEKWGTLWSWTHQCGAARIQDPPVEHRICPSHHSTDPRPAHMGDRWGCVCLPGFYTLLGTRSCLHGRACSCCNYVSSI